MSDIVVHQPQPTGLDLQSQMDYSKALAAASIIPKDYRNQPANILVAIGYAQALGEAPIAALTDVYVVNGRPSMSASMMHRRALEAGHRVRVVANDQEATASIWRRDDPSYEHKVTWTIQQAQAAGLTKNPTWKSFPAAMLRSRAISEACRIACPEVLGPAKYTPDELGGAFADAPSTGPAAAPQATTKVSRRKKDDVESVSTEPAQDAPADPESDAPTEAQRRKMFASLKDLGLTERADILEYVSGITGREITTSNDLTRAEISAVIDSLNPTQEDPNA